jgi:hypothetical protein
VARPGYPAGYIPVGGAQRIALGARVRARARSRLTLRRRLTVPLCTVRIERSCRLPLARHGFSTSPVRWGVYRTCRIADVAISYIYMPDCIPPTAVAIVN